MLPVRFNYADILPFKLTAKTRVKEFISFLFENEHKHLKMLNYIFCSDIFLLQINMEFLKHNYYTDIITFDLSTGHSTVGEIYISVDTVRTNAVEHNTTFTEEMLRVLFHGSLHLCGYKDKKKSEITIMREKEDYYLQLFFQKYS